MTSELAEIESDENHSAIKVSTADDCSWVLIQQDGDKVCMSRAQLAEFWEACEDLVA